MPIGEECLLWVPSCPTCPPVYAGPCPQEECQNLHHLYVRNNFINSCGQCDPKTNSGNMWGGICYGGAVSQ